jgi:ribonuclease BN (tRNA processing enzyme)
MTVLGKSPAWQDAGGACSGYLAEAGETRLLLDCGPGVLAQLREYADYAAVDAIVISHVHADHVLDLVPYASALRYSPRAEAGGVRPPVLHVPPGAREQLGALCRAVGMSADHIERSFAVVEYEPDEGVEVGDFALRFQPVPHYVACNAIDVAADGLRLTFSADCGPNRELPVFAGGTDLLLIEATLTAPDEDEPRGHLTAAEAGEHGRLAGARRLVLTHISDEIDLEQARARAAETFGGSVDVAVEGAVYAL